MLIQILKIFLGLGLLVAGAQLLVRGASRLAIVIGISPLVVGLTVVAFGTSAPELAVSLASAINGQSEIIVGNVVGSNIYNILFILGLSALISPLTVAPQLIRLDVPVMIGVAVLFYFLALDNRVSRADGALLVTCIIIYTVFVVRKSKAESSSVQAEYKQDLIEAHHPTRRIWQHLVYIGLGLVLLSAGSSILVNGAVAIARALQVSELIIGMTIVTIGTTAPEVTACLVASYRKEGDIAVGNVVGSNIFNVLSVMGAGALVSPTGVAIADTVLVFSLPVMIAVSVACLPIFFAGHRITRWEGGLFVLFFALYVAHLILDAREDRHLRTLQHAVLYFVLPISVVTVAVSAYREWHARSASNAGHPG